jgi:peroxiredoxin
MIKLDSMKACKILLLLIFLLSCQIAFTQTLNSSITIRMSGGRVVVSGIVPDDFVKKEVIEKIKTQLGGNADFSKLTIQRSAEPFRIDWRTELDKSLLKIKGWESGVFIFSNSKTLADKIYPLLPEEIANAEFLLTNGQRVSLKDYKNKVVVLFLFASWVAPGIEQAAQLNNFYRTVSSRNIEIIGINADDDPNEKREFPKLGKKLNLQYKLGFMNTNLFPQFVAISKLNGIPQTFIVVNGRLRGVFTGGSPRIQRKLEETVLEILDENNL